MNILRKSYLGVFITCSLVFCSFTGVISLNEATIVHAISSQLSDAKARVAHLNKSLHSNYLGLKNQAQWQSYIKGIRSSIAKIPLSEKSEADKLTVSTNKAESLVNALSRINQVEKSISANAPRMGNVRQWTNYLILGSQDLAKVDKLEFSREINILTNRMVICENIVNKVEEDFGKKFDVVSDLFDTAHVSGDTKDAWKALEEAGRLPSCEESDMIEYECRLLLADMGEITLTSDEVDLKNAYYLFLNVLEKDNLDTINTESITISEAIKGKVQNGVNVTATKVFSNPDKGEELFNIVLSKGDYKIYPIGVLFK